MTVGRGVWRKKALVSDYRTLDMKTIAKSMDFETAGVHHFWWGTEPLRPEASIGLDVCPPYQVRLYYSNTDRSGNREDFDYYVDLDTTPCHYGSKRWWFLCPSCGRRCRILYNGKVFACRICYNLTYRSQQEGRGRFGFLFEAITEGPRLQEEMLFSRSKKKRLKAYQRLMQINEGVELADAWLKQKEKKRNRKAKRKRRNKNK